MTTKVYILTDRIRSYKSLLNAVQSVIKKLIRFILKRSIGEIIIRLMVFEFLKSTFEQSHYYYTL